MQTVQFQCEVITPMFMAGADPTSLEWRPPSIKGVLRFWWRAINGHLSLAELKRIEGDIFGDTSQRSKVIIIVREQPHSDAIESNPLLPHKSGSSRPDSYKIKSLLHIEFKLVKPIKLDTDTLFDFNALKNLFTLVCVLGGFGKRTRRGMGSVTIKEIKENEGEWLPYLMPKNIDDILKLLPPPYFFKNQRDNRIESKFGKNEKYPFIKQIQVGRKQSSLTLKIGDVTNRFHRTQFANYGESLGKTIGGRFASPVYVSTLIDTADNNYPIITTLNVPSNKASIPLQEEFKNAIL